MGSLFFMSAQAEDFKNQAREESVNSIRRFKLYSFFILGFLATLIAIYVIKAIS